MTDELSTDPLLLDEISELDSLIRQSAQLYAWPPEQLEQVMGIRRRLSPDDVRLNLSLLRAILQPRD